MLASAFLFRFLAKISFEWQSWWSSFIQSVFQWCQSRRKKRQRIPKQNVLKPNATKKITMQWDEEAEKKINFILQCLKELIRNFTIIMCRCHWWTWDHILILCVPSERKIEASTRSSKVKCGADKEQKSTQQQKKRTTNEKRRRNDGNLLISAHYSKHCITKMRSLRSSLTDISCIFSMTVSSSLPFRSSLPSLLCSLTLAALAVVRIQMQTFSFGWLDAFVFFNFVLKLASLGDGRTKARSIAKHFAFLLIHLYSHDYNASLLLDFKYLFISVVIVEVDILHECSILTQMKIM